MAYGDERAAVRGPEFGPAPAGFSMGAPGIGDRDPALLSERGCCFWLSDTRVDATGPDRVWTSRLVQQVTAGDGLQSAASFEVAFNPSYERLVIHGVRVWRDGGVRDAASPQAFELFRRELNLERAVYDGRLTAHMIVPDVRVGDVVDTCFSVIGTNPVLKDSLSFTPRLQWSAPVVETRVELRLPAGRAVTIKAFGKAPKPVDETVDGVRTLRWRALDVPPWRHENDSPPWHVGFGSVHVTDATTWGAVADLFRDFYAPPERLPETLEAAVVALMEARPDPAARAVAGLRLVQDALRYHSVGVGDGGFRPRPVEAIWATRYGDCKDASRLLVAVLRRMGIEAAPALVNTRVGPALEHEPANATAFDHCIVRVTIDGGRWWLDPTLTAQGGDLEHLSRPRHVWSLPLIENAQLERMRDTEIPTVCETRETWTFDRLADRPAKLEMRTIYRDWRADDIRRWLANDGPRNVARRLRESLEAEYGQAVEAAPLEVRDGGPEGWVELVELYDIDRPFQPWDEGRLRFLSRDDVVGPNLRDLETVRRFEPIDLGAPRRVVTERVFNLPTPVDVRPWDVRMGGPATELVSSLEWRTNRQMAHVLDLTVLKRVVEVESARDHFAAVREARHFNGVSFVVGVEKGRLTAPPGAGKGRGGGITWLGWLVVGVLALSAFARLASGLG